MRAAVRWILGQKPLATRTSLTLTTEGTMAFRGSRASTGLALALMAAKSSNETQVQYNIGMTGMKLDSTISAVVTGGASGLGEGTARAIAATAAKVALFDLNAEKGEAIAAEIAGVFCQVDAAGDAPVAAAFAKARAAH